MTAIGQAFREGGALVASARRVSPNDGAVKASAYEVSEVGSLIVDGR